VFGNVESHKKTLLEELRILDGLEEERALVAEEKLRKIMVISELEKATLLEEISWWQKLRALWLKEGHKLFSIEWLTRIGETTPLSRCY